MRDNTATKDYKKFFFTFGTDPAYPFQRGWIEITAPGRKEAVAIFRALFPDRTEGIVNCAFVYTENEFSGTPMATGFYPDEFCHMRFGPQG